VTVLIPKRGISVISAPGGAFHDPAADASLFTAIKTHLDSRVPLVELNVTINDPAFAKACADSLLENIRACKS
jgi:uncharacterized protein (UPF0261 family)